MVYRYYTGRVPVTGTGTGRVPVTGTALSSNYSSLAKWGHTAYVVTANTSFAFTIYGMKWDLPPLGILSRGVLVEVYYVVL